ncbi:hypothetical protein EYF80_032219 [Liparis tanakae]|uniref:Uncharacterized protein n=1 Tax=Liparis tanakae TaxID=230148 RepID=A0A4Z2GXQ3_9TELE|nr:hypothetical protein EYF80_032219 [Liparis tanakae]
MSFTEEYEACGAAILFNQRCKKMVNRSMSPRVGSSGRSYSFTGRPVLALWLTCSGGKEYPLKPEFLPPWRGNGNEDEDDNQS